MGFDFSRAMPCFERAHSPDETAPVFIVDTRNAPVAHTFSRTLVVKYAIDHPDARVFVRSRDLDAAGEGVTMDALHAHAVGNLRALVGRKKLHFERHGPLHVARLDGLHDTCLLLLDELWDPPTRIADCNGDLVAAVPSRSGVLLTSTDAAGGIHDLRERVAQSTFCSEVFVRRDGGWHPFEG